jgi:hypothetical protein
MPRIRNPRDVYTADMGQPPDEPDMGSVYSPTPPATGMPMTMPRKIKRPKRSGIRPGGVWTEDSGLPPPMEPDDASAGRKFAKGGSASRRGDGIAQRGKTRGRFV